MPTSSDNASAGRRRKPEIRQVDIGKLFEKLPPHAIEAECALLGSMILDWKVCGDVLQIVAGPEAFYKQAHGEIYAALLDLYNNGQSIDLVQLKQKLADRHALEDVGGTSYLIELAEKVPSAASAPYYATLVQEKSLLRKLIEATGHILDDCYNSDEAATSILDTAERAIFQIAQNRKTDDASDLKTLLDETMRQLEQNSGRMITGVETGFFELDEMLSGLQRGEMIIIAARPSMGKAQPVDTPVLTTRGFKPMGELRVGDELASVDGSASQVAGVYPQGRRQVYRVTFADGRSTECCQEHLWRVMYRGWPAPRVLETRELMQLLTRKRYHNRLFVETFAGMFGDDTDLPLDPWLLGVLLGDGTLGGSSVRLASSQASLLEGVKAATQGEIEVVHAGRYDYRLVQAGGAHRAGVAGVVANPIKQALGELELWNVHAHTKFIPPRYLEASRDSRLRLLCGLLDTDGWVERWGSVRFCTVSQRLADDVVQLVRSLGGTASHSLRTPRYTHRGELRDGRQAYVCNIQMPDTQGLFTLENKRLRVQAGRRRQRRLNIASIEPSRIVQTQCIAVTHPSHLYVTEDYIVTHNTAFAVNMAEHIACDRKQPVAVFSLEMGKQQLAQRLLCSRSGVDSHRLRRNILNQDDFLALMQCVDQLSTTPLFIDDTPGLSILALRAKARRLAMEHDIKAIFIDYLQLMSAGGRVESRQQEVSEISRSLKALARELKVPVVVLSQLNRQAEGREGHRPRMSDLRESGSIEQDADVVMLLHREDYYKRGMADAEMDNKAEIIVAKQRNGPTGTVELLFDGGTTRFRNLAAGHRYTPPPGSAPGSAAGSMVSGGNGASGSAGAASPVDDDF